MNPVIRNSLLRCWQYLPLGVYIICPVVMKLWPQHSETAGYLMIGLAIVFLTYHAFIPFTILLVAQNPCFRARAWKSFLWLMDHQHPAMKTR